MIVFGLLAAVSAMLLVGSLRASSKEPDENISNSQIAVILAAKSLPAMTVITSDLVIEMTVSKDNLPKGYFTSSTQTVGKILAIPVTKDQVLTKSCLVSEGAGSLYKNKSRIFRTAGANITIRKIIAAENFPRIS